MTKNNILIITMEYGEKIGGGVGRVINGLTEYGLNQLSCSILYLQFTLNPPGWQAVFIRNQKGTLHKACSWKSYTRALTEIIDKEKITVVHFVHSGFACLRCLDIIRKKYPSIQCIYSCHSISHYEAAIRRNDRLQIRVEKKIISKVDHIHVLNKTSYNYLEKSYPVVCKKRPVSIIPNGIARKAFRIKDEQFKIYLSRRTGKDTSIIIGCMSRWSFGKGLEYLLDAIPLVTQFIPGIKLILAGRKKMSWENRYYQYQSMIDKKIRRIKDSVISPGWLDDKQRNTLLAMSDIWIMPSLHEYFPYSILEPMAAGVPIISSRIASVCELITENEEAVFYEPEDSAELAEKIIHLVNSPGKRRRLAANAGLRAERDYGWEQVVEQYKKLYDGIGGDNNPACIYNQERKKVRDK